MFAESVLCQLGVAKGNRKVVPRMRTGYCEWRCCCSVVWRRRIVPLIWVSAVQIQQRAGDRR